MNSEGWLVCCRISGNSEGEKAGRDWGWMRVCVCVCETHSSQSVSVFLCKHCSAELGKVTFTPPFDCEGFFVSKHGVVFVCVYVCVESPVCMCKPSVIVIVPFHMFNSSARFTLAERRELLPTMQLKVTIMSQWWWLNSHRRNAAAWRQTEATTVTRTGHTGSVFTPDLCGDPTWDWVTVPRCQQTLPAQVHLRGYKASAVGVSSRINDTQAASDRSYLLRKANTLCDLAVWVSWFFSVTAVWQNFVNIYI